MNIYAKDVSTVLLCCCLYLAGSMVHDTWSLLPFAMKVISLSALFTCAGLAVFMLADGRWYLVSRAGLVAAGYGLLLLFSALGAEAVGLI